MTLKKAIVGGGVLALAMTAATGWTSAAPPGRDVIGDANAICAASTASTDPRLIAACNLQFKTDGEQIIDIDNGCVAPLPPNGDNGVVDYLLRNCDLNENALLRKASSAILSLNDFVNKGKVSQAGTAAGYLCTYADKYMTLQGAGKLSSTEDLAADAENIAKDLGFGCF